MSLASLSAAVRIIDQVVSSLDLGAITCDDAARLVDVFIKGERLCHAGRTMSAARAAEGRIHSDDGCKDASSWLAGKTGEPVRQARADLETASRLASLDETCRAFRAGELSGRQAQTIAEAAAADPSAEKELLARARTGSLRELHDECERVKAASRSAEEAEARYERTRRERFLRIWNGSDGATKGQFSLTPDAGARLLASLQLWADRFFEDARRAAVRESSDAYMADALVAAVTGLASTEEVSRLAHSRVGHVLLDAACESSADHAGRTKDSPRESGSAATTPGAGQPLVAIGERDGRTRRAPPPTTVICRVDLSALRRGETSPGEMCEIPGVGPVPVSTARDLLTDCFLKLAITEGVDVHTVVHYGRTLTAHQRTALEYRDPYCVVPGCGRSFGLENDHIAEFALGGPTSLDNLCRLCAQHHALKTHQGYRIRGRPGSWEWIAPNSRDNSATHPPSTPPSPGHRQGADSESRSPQSGTVAGRQQATSEAPVR